MQFVYGRYLCQNTLEKRPLISEIFPEYIRVIINIIMIIINIITVNIVMNRRKKEDLGN